MVTAIIRVAARIGSAITSAYERALHIPPGSSKTVCLAPTAPDSTISHSRPTAIRLARFVQAHPWWPRAMAPRREGSTREDRGRHRSRGCCRARLVMARLANVTPHLIQLMARGVANDRQ